MRLFSLLFTLLISVTFAFGQHLHETKPVAKAIEQAQKNGATFKTVDLFEATATSAANKANLSSVLEAGSVLKIDTYKMAKFIAKPADAMHFSLPQVNKSALELELVRVDIFDDNFSVKTSTSNGQSVSVDLGVHYHGIVKGDAHTTAAISIFNGEISGLISLDNGETLVLGKLEGNNPQNEHVLYFANDMEMDLSEVSCATPDDGQGYDPAMINSSNPDKNGNCVKLYIEVNDDIYTDKGSLQNTINYITGVFNQSAILFANESITFEISEIFVWQTRSPYKGRDAGQFLTKFQQLRTSFNGDLGHLVSYKGSGGIAAGFSGICNPNRAQSLCFSGINPSYSNVPTYSWTVMVFTHEMGHLLGSRHTHACVWNGNNTAIDGCYTTEGTCPSPAIPSNGGTVMSYCHLQSVGINLNNGFGPQPGNVIRNNVANGSCLTTCGTPSTPTCTDGIMNGDETGVDCGGSTCPPCNAATCTDGIMNGDETGIDCGGSTCPPCNTGGTCDAPDGLVASNIKPNRAVLNWNSVSGANDYTVELRTLGAASWSQGTTSGTSINATGLSNGTTYEWRVRSNCTGSSSAWSSICTFTAGNSSSGACGTILIRDYSNTLKLFPNPTSDQVTIEFDFEMQQTATLQVFNIYGQVVRNEVIDYDSNFKTLDVNDLSTGVYIIRVQSEGRNFTQKLMIQR